MRMLKWLSIVSVLVLAACGGGGGGSGGGGNPPGGGSPPGGGTPPPEPTRAELQAAARFLSMASFGPTLADIDDLAREDIDTWLTRQFSTAQSRHLPVVQRYALEYGADVTMDPPPGLYRRFAFFEHALNAPDQLRQLTAYALSQIFVVSDNVDALFIDPRALSSYYDMLAENAFGNFRDLLLDVTLHPAMGFYLSHVNNGRSDPVANTFPDENYAREVMQLFSIGLFELNEDGSQRLDGNNNPIPTYDNQDIREFSKVFTGLSYGPEQPGGGTFFGSESRVMHVPMEMFDAFHEPGEKFLLNGAVVPDGQSGMQDIQDAIDNLFNHPNVGPFIGTQLIQRLVTSNPSPAYVARVSAAFAGSGGAPRGDMQAVLRAILTDPEAQSGLRLREPFRRYLAMNRSLHAGTDDSTVPGAGFVAQFLTQQHVLSAPSVFNFYLPQFRPAGPIGDQGLTAPEFQITDASTIVGMTNLVAYTLYAQQSIDSPDGFADITLDLAPWEARAAVVEDLVDDVDLVFFAGTMGDGLRQVLLDAGNEVQNDLPNRTRLVLYLALASPDYAIEGN